MTTSYLVYFVGFGLLYALIASSVVIAAQAMFTRRLQLRWWPATYLTTFFLALTHHPFPNPASLDCSRGGEPARLVPFRFVPDVLMRWRSDVPATTWVLDLNISSAAMNLFLCMAIGAALVPCLSRPHSVALFAVLLSGLVEVSQITGIFGLYPCPYRQFDVDDLVLNVTGVLSGYALLRHFGGQAFRTKH